MVDDKKPNPISVTLARLIEEVAQEIEAEGETGVRPESYNRMHNRHNRSHTRPWPVPEPKPEDKPKPKPEDET